MTGRFRTSRVDVLARLKVVTEDGKAEVLEGTTVHPIWSVDRDDWVPLGELVEGEQLLADNGPATVRSIQLVRTSAIVRAILMFSTSAYV